MKVRVRAPCWGGALALVLGSTLPTCSRAHQSGSITGADGSVVLSSTPAAHELVSGVTHRYQLDLKVGDYVELKIEHSAIDIGAKLTGPDNVPVVDIGYRQSGPVTIADVAKMSGIYFLDIRSLEKLATTGRYVLAVKALRHARPQDMMRAQAWRDYTATEALRADWRADAAPVLLDGYRAAQNEWKRAGDRSGQAIAGMQIGEVYHAIGKSEEGLHELTEALRINRGADPEAECAGLNAIARIKLELVGTIEARERANQARQLAIKTHDRTCEADALNVIGVTAQLGGQVRESITHFREAFSISNALRDRRGEAEAFLNLGYSYADLGQIDDAQRSYESALTLWRSVDDRRGEAETLTGLGQLHGMTGQDQQALVRYEEARELFERLGNRVGLASVLGSIGVRRSRSGDFATAADYIAKAVAMFKAVKHQNGEAGARLNLAMCLASLGRHSEALEHNMQALAIARAIADRKLEARVLEAIASNYAALDQSDTALRYYEQSWSLARQVGDPRGQVYALHGLGRLLNDRGNYKDSLSHLEEALRISQQTKERFLESLVLYDIARSEVALGNLDVGLQRVVRSLELVEDLRTAVASLDLRASLLASVRDRHELQIDLLMQLGGRRDNDSSGAVMAFEASERTRARSFLDALTQARAGIREGVAPALLEREASTRRALNAAAQRLTRVQSDPAHAREFTELTAEIDKETTIYKEIEAQIRAQSPRYASLMQPQPLTLADVQHLIEDDRTVLLEYFLGQSRSYVWAVTRKSITAHVLPSRDEIERRVRLYRDALATPVVRRVSTNKASAPRSIGGIVMAKRAADLDRRARDVAQLLLAPTSQHLLNRRLLIVADGILHNLPFAALPDPRFRTSTHSVPLIAQHEVVNLPSGSTLALLRGAWNQPRHWQKAVIVFADPVYEPDDVRLAAVRRAESAPSASLGAATRSAGHVGISRLAQTRREARGIAALASPTDVVLDFQASRAVATTMNLTNYRIVHFATHGVADDQHPELSGIVLSLLNERGEALDGFLRLHDIYNLKIPADLVVLSSCSTALGKEIVGEGLIGLVRGFMYAGARRVAASLWEVEDEATSELMTHFYRGMFDKRLTPAAALRAAQLEMLKDRRWNDPFYWAAFVLQGEWD